MNRYLLLIAISTFFLWTSICDASSTSASPSGGHPWFTGPLLTPTAFVLLPGTGNMEPYLYWTVRNGEYGNRWKAESTPHFYRLNPQLTFKFGLLDGLDFSGTIQSYSSWTQEVVGTSFGDLPLGFGIQIFKIGPPEEIALCRIIIQETFPTGRYQNLNPDKYRTDSGGQGSYATQVGICFSKQFKFQNDRFFRARWSFSATYSAPVRVQGFNVYGGDSTTKGTQYPGVSCIFLTSGEYTMTDRWTAACDLKVAYSAKNRFSGRSQDTMKAPLSLQFSLAPAIEYNWNSKIGIIIGPWFTFAGKNSRRFLSLVGGLNYNF